MKSVFQISALILLIGLVTAVPISKHYCDGMLVQSKIMQEEESSCCEHEEMPMDCCYNEINFYTDDHSLSINFSNIEIGDLTDFWVENLLFEFNHPASSYSYTNSYTNTSEISPKNEVGLYKYVQSFLI